MGDTRRSTLILGALLVALFVASVFLGRYPQPYWTPPRLLWEDPLAYQLVLNLRLPRIIMACLLGMVLSAAGFALQMLFRNPLVEPGFLGVSQGAAFGAALGIIVVGASSFALQGIAALFALLGLALSTLLARRIRYGGWTLRLILAGIAVSALFSAGVGLLKYVADPLTQLPELVFWLLGALWGVTWTETLSIVPVAVVALVIAYLMRWRLNLLSLEDKIAISLGSAPARERGLLLVAVVSATAAVVSVSGIVGWIGLIVPQFARRIFGADAQRALPGSILLGGNFALVCDDIARVAFAGEVPLGILTSLLGATLFALMMVAPAHTKSPHSAATPGEDHTP
ncbi:MAG: iron ABC transporter permease [Anaerolineae bacterium]|jgi:iron complex transport system permease protein|nr:iron ABC transporter permease [Anaerolineae bacterium]